MPMVGMAISRGDLGGQRFGHAFQHHGEGAGLGHRLGVGFQRRPFRFGAARGAEAALDIDHLRRQPDMAHHRNAALGEIMDGFGHAGAAFQLDRGGAGFLDHARGIAEGDRRAFLVGAERHVDHDQRALASRASPPCRG